MKITDLFLGEHGVFYAMFDYMEGRAADASLEEVKALCAVLTAALASHAHLEDDALFKELDPHIGGGGPLVVMRMEHDEIEGTLLKIPSQSDPNEARRMMRHVVDVARSHFAKEENILYPMAEQILGEDGLERLTSKWNALRLKGATPGGGFC